MATVQNLFDAAVQRSNLNDEDLIPTAQILRYVSSFEKNVYLMAAKKNPNFFGREGNTSSRASSSDEWFLTTAPGNVAAVTKIEVESITGTVTGVSVGDEVNIVDIREPLYDVSPRVYIRDKTIYEYNGELQDDSSNYVTRLKVFYSYLPSTYTDMSDTMDIPEEFEQLVVLPLARLMAIRDQRPDEATPIDQEFQMNWGLFVDQLTVFDEGTTRGIRETAARADIGG